TSTGGRSSPASRRTAYRTAPGRRQGRSSRVKLVCLRMPTSSLRVLACGNQLRGRCPPSLGLDHAELFHLREDVGNPPDLSDPAIDEPHYEDLRVGDRFAGRPEAVEFAQVGAGNRVLRHDLVALPDQILDRAVKVGEGSVEP